MAGIYIHIPFCKRKCVYCDFFSVAATPEKVESLLHAIRKEYAARRHELGDEAIGSVYFGGGTPSLLTPGQISETLSMIANLAEDAEITLEVNPDDMTDVYAESVKEAGINRVSMGVQSFSDQELALLNRRHSARQAIGAVESLKKAGLSNISIDLIYGIPGQTTGSWEKSLHSALSLSLPHLSAYNLTYEDGTRLSRMRDRKEISPCDDDLCVGMFDRLADATAEAGYEHYEISNFALPGMHSRHNSAYWDFTPYLGLGPSAHSFDGRTRRYNPASLSRYISDVERNGIACSAERETTDQLYNEWVMTRLRTMRGMNLEELSARFGERYRAQAEPIVANHLADGCLTLDGSTARLTKKGIMLSDMIFRDLFIVD